jgi:uncharacterized protein with HEPN domain
MITDADVKKLKKTFVAKEDLKKFATKDKMNRGFIDIIKFIGETKNDIMKELNEFRNEMNEFRNEIRDINRGNQAILNSHESRIAHLEYINKS